MRLIVGLGNVGDEYVATRHNIGFMVLDALRHRHAVRWKSERHRDGLVYGDWHAGGVTVRLMQPTTMMNRSGEAVQAAVRLWELKPEAILIVHDEANLPLGTLRLRPQGGAGGHHGLASCLEQLNTEELPRLRVGIGVDALPGDLTAFVLSAFTPDEHAIVERALARAAEACEVWALESLQTAMNRVNAEAAP